MQGVKTTKGDRCNILEVTDIGQVPKWRKQIKKYKSLLRRKTLTAAQRKQINDNIIVLDTYIFLSGGYYSCSRK